MKNSGAILRTIGVLTLCGMALGTRGAAFFDDFESYAVGSSLNGQGGWAGPPGQSHQGDYRDTRAGGKDLRASRGPAEAPIVTTRLQNNS